MLRTALSQQNVLYVLRQAPIVLDFAQFYNVLGSVQQMPAVSFVQRVALAGRLRQVALKLAMCNHIISTWTTGSQLSGTHP